MRPFPATLLTLIALGPTAARGQQFDATGPAVPPDTVDVGDPVLGYGGARAGQPTFTILPQSATRLLVTRLAQGETGVDSAILDDVAGGSLAFQTGIYGPLGFGVAMPVWWVDQDGQVDSGVAPGDLSLHVPVSLVRGEVGHFGLVPYLTLPTGDADRFLGQGSVVGGGALTGGLRKGVLVLGADVGVDASGATNVVEWPGGPHLRVATDVGLVAGDLVGAHLEVRSRTPMSPDVGSIPIEALGTLKVRPQDRVAVVAGAGRAITRGVGASAFRMMLGVQLVAGNKDKDVTEPLVGEPPPLAVQVVDADGVPITGATLAAGGLVAQTDFEGYGELPPRAFREGALKVKHPHYITVEEDLDQGKRDAWQVTMERKPVTLAVQVVGPKGALMEVDVALDGPYDPGPPTLDLAGVRRWELRPGTWFVRMASPGLGSQERTIVIEEARVEPIRVDAILATGMVSDSRVRVEVVDRLGRPVEDAVVALSDRDLGTTGTGGDVVIEGLGRGGHDLVVRSERFGERSEVKILVDQSGEKTVKAVVDWRPGSVQVVATNPRGKPVDATVNFIGPSNLPERNVGSDGDEVFVLRPGTWDVEVAAPGLGTQRRTIEVTEEEGDLVVVDVGLIGDERGDAAVEVQLRDVEGNPASGVDVYLDDQRVGKTGREGTVELVGLKRGERTLSWGTEDDTLRDGRSTVVLGEGTRLVRGTTRYEDGVTRVVVRDENGVAVNAQVSLAGPDGARESVKLGSDGEHTFVLGPGEWTATMAASGLAPQKRLFVVEQGTGTKQELGFTAVDSRRSGSVSVAVVDPEGNPVDGAVVSLEGTAVGRSAGGEPLVSEGVATGRVTVAAVAPGMRPAEVDARVSTGEESAVEVPLEWAPGALRVEVTGADGQPLDDARVTLRSPDGRAAVPTREVDGSTVIGAAPGSYEMVVQAPGQKTQIVPVSLSDDAELTVVPVAMAPRPEGAGGGLVVQAEDEQGVALVDAEVLVEGRSVGRTSASGTVVVDDPGTGRLDVTIVPAHDQLHEQTEIKVPLTRRVDKASGEVTAAVVVEDAARDVSIRVEDSEGNAVDAEIVAVEGRSEVESLEVGETELGRVALKPGSYTITAKTETGELATTELVVPRLVDARDSATAFIPGMDLEGRSQDGSAAVAVQDGTPMLSMRVEAIEATVSDGTIVPVAPILFDTDKATLRADADSLIRDLALWLKVHREASLVEVGGHTDDVGGVVYNQQLSERRAKSVMQALIALGVAPERLEARGYGLSRPVTANMDADARQANRRVELAVQDWIER